MAAHAAGRGRKKRRVRPVTPKPEAPAPQTYVPQHPAVDEPSDGSAREQERIALRFAEHDARRMAELTEMIKRWANCRYCGRQITDERLAASRGVCSAKACRRIAIRDALAKLTTLHA